MKINTFESHKRSIAKAITYRFYQSFLISPLIIYILTQNLLLAFQFGLLEVFVKIPAYYLFERLWSMVKHGYREASQ